jgi:hypothetical protein
MASDVAPCAHLGRDVLARQAVLAHAVITLQIALPLAKSQSDDPKVERPSFVRLFMPGESYAMSSNLLPVVLT